MIPPSLANLVPSLPGITRPHSQTQPEDLHYSDGRNPALQPHDGAPSVGDPSLIPPKYRQSPAAHSDEPARNRSPLSGHTSSRAQGSVPTRVGEDPGNSRLGKVQIRSEPSSASAVSSALDPSIVPSRPAAPISLPSQLLDAPARAAMGFPNAASAAGQARAVRGGEARTPEYEVDGLGLGREVGGHKEDGGINGHEHGHGMNGDVNANTSKDEEWPPFAHSPPTVPSPSPGTGPSRLHLPLSPVPGSSSHLHAHGHGNGHSATSNERAPLLSPTPRYADTSAPSSPSWLPSNLPPSPRPDLSHLSGPPHPSHLGDHTSGFAFGSTGPSIPLSRSSSAASTRSVLRRIFIDRPNTPSQHLSKPTFPPPSLSTYTPIPHRPMSTTAKLNLFINQLISVVVSTFFLTGVVLWALSAEIRRRLPNWIWPEKVRKFPWDDDRYWRREGRKVSKEPADYARQVGMEIENQVVETDDGYFLRVHKVVDPEASKRTDGSGKGGFPVLVLHGLFQSSGSFVTSEERSLAFWLARQGGYQVYLGNTRGVFDMGHRTWGRNDPRFWDWTIRELAMYDLPALVEHVCRETGYDKIAFIGHSQGNGLTFISLSLGMCPNLGSKLSVFIALAPAVYAGPLTTGFPFTTLNRLEWGTWKRFFGVLDFIPLMRWAYDYAPPTLFAVLGYTMFAFLFGWTDTNWLLRRKTKMFRFTPTPVSSASIFWWCGKGGFADRKCTLDDTLDRWYDDRFPPLSIYYGGRDYLVLTEPLLERLEQKEKDVEVIKVTKLDKSEHCDFYWAAEAVEWAYESFRDDIERTRPRYREEMESETPVIRVEA